METWGKLIPKGIHEKYELHNFNNAVEILSESYPQEYQELISALEDIDIKIEDITASGGNESKIPKKFSKIMRPRGWKEVKITVPAPRRVSDFCGGNNTENNHRLGEIACQQIM